VRIIAGRYRGRVLQSFRGHEIRPTSDRLRESLFNILQARVERAAVWDAFAGTGALGLEALSRGASHVVFTEKDRSALKILKKNIEILNAGDLVEVIEADAVRWARSAGTHFDLVFVDPPYDFKLYLELADAIRDSGVCGPESLVVIEHSRRSQTASRLTEQLTPYRQVRQGDTVISFFAGSEFSPPPQPK
jgi:16S rRNA (guanine(966)-N(2))-methyltransferase RsmD